MKSPAERLSGYVRENGLKASSQRNAILDIMIRESRHLTVEELYDICKIEHPEIGIATIYRTVKLLHEAGIARELRVNNSVTRYEVISDESHHDHIVCVKCGRFVEIHSDIIEKEQERIAKQEGFSLTDHTLVLYGNCRTCGAARIKEV